MRKVLLAFLVASACAPAVAMAEQGDWVVRLRAANISPDEDSSLRATAGATTLTGELTVGSNTIPEIDISYYVTKNIALELILALGSRHDVNLTNSALNGVSTPSLNEKLGEVNVLPPTLSVQWHFNPDQTIDPYVGAGVNYTRFMDKNLEHSVGGDIDVDRNSFGLALQAGVDINLQDGWLLNADVKKLWIDTDVHFSHGNGLFAKQKIDSLDIDPWVLALGVGKKF
jgi:outer membrane protein